jgi:hypothetical protein
MSSTKPASAGALYYPYIHIKEVDWLRANLLIFPCVKRMIPRNFIPSDNPAVQELATRKGHKDALLQRANLYSRRVEEAQSNLANKLQRDANNPSFVQNYGFEAARRLVEETPEPDEEEIYGFQIHAEKLSYDLKHALAGNQLAWKPDYPEPYDMSSVYVEVHPRVGQAVMSTLAIASALGDGLDIVGDERSGELHRCLLEKKMDDVYDSWLGLEHDMAPPAEASGEELLEFILGISGDLSKLSGDALRELADEREPIDALIAALREEAANIPAMDPGEKRDDAFKQAASKIMKKWEGDRNNLYNFGHAFFGKETTDLTTKFASTVADKTLTGLGTGVLAAGGAKATLGAGIAASAANVGWIGTLAAGGVIGAGAGLIIGVIAHGGITYHKQAQRAKNSPYRFLTTLEDAGVFWRL